MLANRQQPRNDPRETVTLHAQIVDSSGSRKARVVDVSSRGLMARMPQPPDRGEFITIHFESCEMAGQVRWVDGQRFGVTLRERIDPRSLLEGRNAKRRKGRPLAPAPIEEDTSLKGVITTYSVLGLTALSTAYLIVTYIIF